MNLLEATSALLDFVKTSAPENVQIRRAVKRMEKRLEVLQARAEKERERRLWKAWDEAVVHFQGLGITCEHCGFEFDPVAFFRNAEVSGRGQVKQLDCAKCGYRMMGTTPAIDETDAQFVTDGCWLPGR